MIKKNKNNKKMRDIIIESYSHFLSKFPVIMIIIVLIFSGFSIYYSSIIKNKSLQYRGMLPDNIEVIKANNIFTDSFGGSDSAKFVLEINPEDHEFKELRDIRDPDVVLYASLLEKYISSSSEVVEIMSATETLKIMNDGTLPKDKQKIIELISENPLLSGYFSDDGTMMIISLRLRDDYDENKVVEDMEEAIRSIKIPFGLKVNVGGDSISGVYINKQMGNDISKTSTISMIGIIIILILTFGSLKYAFLPLTTIIVGIILAFGYIGFIGLEMSSATSGVISMIMGIGIDFGIQIITRFRQDLEKNKKISDIDERIESSMKDAMKFVLMPMFTTTLAAVIGFKSMSMGQLTVMKEMGDMMTYGVVFCFLAAITFVPALTIIIEKISFNIRKKMMIKSRRS